MLYSLCKDIRGGTEDGRGPAPRLDEALDVKVAPVVAIARLVVADHSQDGVNIPKVRAATGYGRRLGTAPLG